MPEPQSPVKRCFPAASRVFAPGVNLLLILMLAGFLLFTFAHDFALGVLALNPGDVLHGQVWQLVTYFVVNDTIGFIFNALAVLFMGSAIEKQWRMSSFLLLWLVVIVACGLAWLAVSVISGREMVGMGGQAGVYGLIASFGMLFRGRQPQRMFGALQGQHLALLFIAIGIILSITQPVNFIWLAGAGVAYLYIKFLWRKQNHKGDLQSGPAGDRGGGFVDLD
jgi:membrane associated rhomboid family serine protease